MPKVSGTARTSAKPACLRIVTNSAGGGNVPTDAGRYEYAPVWPEISRPIERQHAAEIPAIQRGKPRNARHAELENRQAAARPQARAPFRRTATSVFCTLRIAERDGRRVGDSVGEPASASRRRARARCAALLPRREPCAARAPASRRRNRRRDSRSRTRGPVRRDGLRARRRPCPCRRQPASRGRSASATRSPACASGDRCRR